MELLEPRCLSIVRSLAAHLIIEPLSCVVGLIRALRKADSVFLIVPLGQVFDDGARFPEGEISVRVVDCRNTPIWIDRKIFGFFDLRQWCVNKFMGNLQFGKHDCNFWWIWSAFAAARMSESAPGIMLVLQNGSLLIAACTHLLISMLAEYLKAFWKYVL